MSTETLFVADSTVTTMANSFWETVGTAFVRGIAFNRIYSSVRMVSAGVLSAILGFVLSAVGLLQLGYVESLSDPEMLATLMQLEPFVVVAAAVSLGANLSAWLHFGLKAPEAVKSEVGYLSNPVTFLASAVVFAVLLVVVFFVITSLGELSAALGFGVAALVVLYRYMSTHFWYALGSTAGQITWLNRIALSVPAVALAAAFALGALPELTLTEWSVVSYYGLIAFVTVSGPVDMTWQHIEDQLDTVAGSLVSIQQLSERREDLRSRAPADCDLDIDVPAEPRSYAEAQETLTRVTALEDWADVYDTYVDAYAALDEALDGSVEERAATGDSDDPATVVATLVRNAHPSHYDEVEPAGAAAEALASIVDSFAKGYVEDVEDFGPVEDLEVLLDQRPPGGTALDRIDELAEAVTV